jgi:hypothetical protein
MRPPGDWPTQAPGLVRPRWILDLLTTDREAQADVGNGRRRSGEESMTSHLACDHVDGAAVTAHVNPVALHFGPVARSADQDGSRSSGTKSSRSGPHRKPPAGMEAA